MTTSTKQHMLNVADYRTLHAYVSALPDDERVAYYYANPDYMIGAHPAYLVHEAHVLTLAGELDKGARLLRDYTDAKWAADAQARHIASLPSTGNRVANAISNAISPTLLGGCGTLAATIAGAPHLAVGVATLFGCFAALGALAGFIAGGRG